jgi:hypothetical protein
MSVNPADDPRERLNYYNGQRLVAADFRTEQGHHDGMRRVLNSSLYSAGIVTGLEVEVDPNDKHRVKVRRGLAFDYLGREIFVPEDVSVPAMGAPSTTKGLVFGNLLVVSYREQRKAVASDACTAGTATPSCGGDLAWRAPSRIVADAVFEVLDSWPADETGKVVIAQLELNAQCQVTRVLTGARKYAMPVKPQKVRPISLEGEKDIDIANEKTLHFHIDGGAPERAILMLRARKFSSLHYTEIGEHIHPLNLSIPDHPAIPDHQHKLSNVNTDQKLNPDDLHFNSWVVREAPEDFAIRLWNQDNMQTDLWNDPGHLGPSLRITNTLHSHQVDPNALTDGAGAIPALHHVFNKEKTESFGSKAAIPPPHQIERDGKPEYTYVRNLRVVLDVTNDITDAIRAQLAKRPGQAAMWDTLGDGTSTHAIASDEGTGEIDLLALGFELGIGTHALSFRLVAPKVGDPDFGPPPADRGGQLQYNLYID